MLLLCFFFPHILARFDIVIYEFRFFLSTFQFAVLVDWERYRTKMICIRSVMMLVPFIFFSLLYLLNESCLLSCFYLSSSIPSVNCVLLLPAPCEGLALSCSSIRNLSATLCKDTLNFRHVRPITVATKKMLQALPRNLPPLWGCKCTNRRHFSISSIEIPKYWWTNTRILTSGKMNKYFPFLTSHWSSSIPSVYCILLVSPLCEGLAGFCSSVRSLSATLCRHAPKFRNVRPSQLPLRKCCKHWREVCEFFGDIGKRTVVTFLLAPFDVPNFAEAAWVSCFS